MSACLACARTQKKLPTGTKTTSLAYQRVEVPGRAGPVVQNKGMDTWACRWGGMVVAAFCLKQKSAMTILERRADRSLPKTPQKQKRTDSFIFFYLKQGPKIRFCILVYFISKNIPQQFLNFILLPALLPLPYPYVPPHHPPPRLLNQALPLMPFQFSA